MKMDSRRLVTFQRTIFVVLFIGYMFYILDRRSFAFNIPSIRQAEQLNSEAIGSVLSSIAIGYAIGKFVCGILVDTYSPSRMFAAGLILCGAVNIAFSFTKSTSIYSFLWFLNGLFQGFGWPACGKLLKRWYSPLLFGTLWSLLSTSMNISASIGPFFCNWITDIFGSWRYNLQGFGLMSMLIAVIVLFLVPDSPDQCGFSTSELDSLWKVTPENHHADKNHTNSEESINQASNKSKPSFITAMKRVLSSPFTYVMSFGFFVSLVCKVAVCDWGPLYIITEKNATQDLASAFTGCLEVGGIVGSILSGFVSDWILSKRMGYAKGHPRNLFLIPCAIFLYISLYLLRTTVNDVPSQHFVTMSLASVIGFCMYSIINVLGVMTIERTASDISGRSHALAALCGNFGMMVGGLPFSIIIKNYSWSPAFFLIESLIFILGIVLVVSQRMTCRIGDLKKEE